MKQTKNNRSNHYISTYSGHLMVSSRKARKCSKMMIQLIASRAGGIFLGRCCCWCCCCYSCWKHHVLVIDFARMHYVRVCVIRSSLLMGKRNLNRMHVSSHCGGWRPDCAHLAGSKVIAFFFQLMCTNCNFDVLFFFAVQCVEQTSTEWISPTVMWQHLVVFFFRDRILTTTGQLSGLRGGRALWQMCACIEVSLFIMTMVRLKRHK